MTVNKKTFIAIDNYCILLLPQVFRGERLRYGFEELNVGCKDGYRITFKQFPFRGMSYSNFTLPKASTLFCTFSLR
jgi:hypothetical protein